MVWEDQPGTIGEKVVFLKMTDSEHTRVNRFTTRNGRYSELDDAL